MATPFPSGRMSTLKPTPGSQSDEIEDSIILSPTPIDSAGARKRRTGLTWHDLNPPHLDSEEKLCGPIECSDSSSGYKTPPDLRTYYRGKDMRYPEPEQHLIIDADQGPIPAASTSARRAASRISADPLATGKHLPFLDLPPFPFLDLPPELRSKVYDELLGNRTLSFSRPHNFRQTAQLARVCQELWWEVNPLLYTTNRFVFDRRRDMAGSYWDTDWQELGYKPVYEFIKMIGPRNRQLLRHITVIGTDGRKKTNAHVPAMYRLYYKDAYLLRSLWILSTHSVLETVGLHFRRLSGDSRILGESGQHTSFRRLVCNLHANQVHFVRMREGKKEYESEQARLFVFQVETTMKRTYPLARDRFPKPHPPFIDRTGRMLHIVNTTGAARRQG